MVQNTSIMMVLPGQAPAFFLFFFVRKSKILFSCIVAASQLSLIWQFLYQCHCKTHNCSYCCLIRLSGLNGDFWRFMWCCWKNLKGGSVVTSTGILLLLLFCTHITCVLRQDLSAPGVCFSESSPGSVKLTRVFLVTRSLVLYFRGLFKGLSGCFGYP